MPLFVVKQKATQKEKPWIHLIMICGNKKRDFSLKSRPVNMILRIINIYRSKQKQREIHPDQVYARGAASFLNSTAGDLSYDM